MDAATSAAGAAVSPSSSMSSLRSRHHTPLPPISGAAIPTTTTTTTTTTAMTTVDSASSSSTTATTSPASAASARRRGGWWDASAASDAHMRQQEIERVKRLVRRTSDLHLHQNSSPSSQTRASSIDGTGPGTFILSVADSSRQHHSHNHNHQSARNALRHRNSSQSVKALLCDDSSPWSPLGSPRPAAADSQFFQVSYGGGVSEGGIVVHDSPPPSAGVLRSPITSPLIPHRNSPPTRPSSSMLIHGRRDSPIPRPGSVLGHVPSSPPTPPQATAAIAAEPPSSSPPPPQKQHVIRRLRRKASAPTLSIAIDRSLAATSTSTYTVEEPPTEEVPPLASPPLPSGISARVKPKPVTAVTTTPSDAMYRDTVAKIANLDKRPRRPAPCLATLRTILDFCLDNNLVGTARSLQAEAPSVMSSLRERELLRGEGTCCAEESKRRRRDALRDLMERSRFEEALESVRGWRRDRGTGSNAHITLEYAVARFVFLDVVNSRPEDGDGSVKEDPDGCVKRARAFLDGEIRPLVKLLDDPYFHDDVKALWELASDDGATAFNPYVDWDHPRAVKRFWAGPSSLDAGSPAFAYWDALNEPETDDDDDDDERSFKLEDAFDALRFRRDVRRCLEAAAAKTESPASSAQHVVQQQSRVAPVIMRRHGPAGVKDEERGPARRDVGSSASRSRGENQGDTVAAAVGGDERVNVASATSGPVDIEKLIPPASVENETSDFALLNTCGPVLGQIRTIDVCTVADSGAIVAASAGGDDRSDRRISIWDVRSGSLIRQLLDNTGVGSWSASHKPIVAVHFHPRRPNLLVTTDMDFDIKLWDWTTGDVVRVWRKWHSRVIWRVAFVPGHDSRLASCSGDQSLKIWDTDAIDGAPLAGSAHANEPFTSFVFSGAAAAVADGVASGLTLIASLSYSIRIYRCRTMALLHTIQMKELKLNKTPISSLCAHPTFDNYILISSDNQLRLFEIASETVLRTYSTRDIGSGTRIEGQFSPCGTFVYCGSWDVRAFTSINAVTSPRRASVSTSSPSSSSWRGDDEANRGDHEARGVYIWRLNSGRLERAEMWAMNEGLRMGPVTVCRWVNVVEPVKRTASGGRPRSAPSCRKVLVAGTVDRLIHSFL